MSPTKTHKQATRLRFVGSPGHFVQGVPQADLDIVERPSGPTQVTPDRARELVATRLYAPDGALPQTAGSEEEGATAPEED